MAREKRNDTILVGRSPQMRKVFRQVAQVAAVNVAVLITGESGTGKELVARAIHRGGPRRGGPFVAMNCGALAPSLVASELFGHEKGAYTGATARQEGRIKAAEGGSLFLDEVATMDDRAQVTLLRVLETGTFQRVGGSQQLRSDVRVIAAMNDNLEQALSAGRFREDIYFRLGAFRIDLPPLRERDGDMELLAETFLTEYSESLWPGRPVPSLSDAALRRLHEYGWPGNVRELQNTMLRSLIMCENEAIDAKDIILDGQDEEAGEGAEIVVPMGTSLDDLEKTCLQTTLDSVHGNRTRASELLGISRKAVYNKMKRYRLA